MTCCFLFERPSAAHCLGKPQEKARCDLPQKRAAARGGMAGASQASPTSLQAADGELFGGGHCSAFLGASRATMQPQASGRASRPDNPQPPSN